MQQSNAIFPEQAGVYCIRSILDGRAYVGSSRSISKRWSQHRSALGRLEHHNRQLQESHDLGGKASLTYEVLENCAIQDLLERERWWTSRLRTLDRSFGFNMATLSGDLTITSLQAFEEVKRVAAKTIRPFVELPQIVQEAFDSPDKLDSCTTSSNRVRRVVKDVKPWDFPEHIVRNELSVSRGWPVELIDKFLTPDIIAENPHNASQSMRLYRKEAVYSAERLPRFKADLLELTGEALPADRRREAERAIRRQVKSESSDIDNHNALLRKMRAGMQGSRAKFGAYRKMGILR